jgi:hypothetical protein
MSRTKDKDTVDVFFFGEFLVFVQFAFMHSDAMLLRVIPPGFPWQGCSFLEHRFIFPSIEV